MSDTPSSEARPMISVICPTVTGREDWLSRCKAAYDETTPDYEFIVILDEPACGPGWVKGAAQAKGDFIHFTADDLVPHAGWWEAATETVERGFLPAPRILNIDGTLQTCGGTDAFTELATGSQTDFSRIPFMSRDQWSVIRDEVSPFLLKAHYFTDNAISFTAALHDIATGIHREFLFTHGFADVKRGAGMTEPERMQFDAQLFQDYANSLLATR